MPTPQLKAARLGLLVASYVAFAFLVAHAALGLIDERKDLLFTLALAAFVSTTCLVDAKIANRQLSCPERLSLLFFWFAAVPIYLIRTRGWWGLFLTVLFGGLALGILVASALAMLVVRGIGG